MRIVVKIGSSSLTTKHELNLEKLQEHVKAVASLKQAGHEVIIVSSGAVAAGYKKLGYPSRPVTLKGKQAAAAIGQSILIQHYADSFADYTYNVAQILLTKEDFTSKKRYQNAYATINELLERQVVPIINENDTISIDELSFGDNDMLSSLVAAHLHADFLIILTDVNGLYTANPATNPHAIKINHVDEITDDIFNMAGGSSSTVGTGGMQTKINAAKYATDNGVDVFVGIGTGADKFSIILAQHGDGTYFTSNSSQQKTIQRWLTLSEPKGLIYIDQGAYEAITCRGKSLLDAGITSIEGLFERGDVIEVYYQSEYVGRGETEQSSEELRHALDERNDEQFKSSIVIHRNFWMKAKEEI
jgi:glutamate 5-kinase